MLAPVGGTPRLKEDHKTLIFCRNLVRDIKYYCPKTDLFLEREIENQYLKLKICAHQHI